MLDVILRTFRLASFSGVGTVEIISQRLMCLT